MFIFGKDKLKSFFLQEQWMLAKVFKILIAELNECPELFNLFLRRIEKLTPKN